MDETKWRSANRPVQSFALLRRLHLRLRRPISHRKLHFFALYCCRVAWPALTDERSRRAVDVAERSLAGTADDDELAVAIREADDAREDANATYATGSKSTALAQRTAALVAAYSVARGYNQSMIAKVRDALTFHGDIRGKADLDSLLAAMSGALRDIFGNPFRPVALEPAWRTSDVVALARGIYEERAFDRMPILADALQDAGCDSADVLDHCRDASLAHVRGCWVVDLLLGKQ